MGYLWMEQTMGIETIPEALEQWLFIVPTLQASWKLLVKSNGTKILSNG